MDKKGFLKGPLPSVKFICQKRKKQNFKIQDDQRELITVLESVSAVGAVLPPSIVYKGVAQYKGWYVLVKAGNKAYFSKSSTGWTTGILG